MFKRILIANRGEIACRIIRTARRMGIETIAVYSEADKDAPHVEMADMAVAIGPSLAVQSYLSVDAIVDACRRSGAEAVHPGYGFLSEQPAFPRALTQAGIVFIGPNAAAMAALGDKIAAKRAAACAGVSVVPGHLGELADDAAAVSIAEEIGYPVMIKAAAGGGGKGMRIASTRAEVVEGFVRARSEAKSSFGDERVFVEKFIADPRHIEIQVLGDKHGNVIHLGERECSIQRRNQKIVEEAPSPLVDAETRARMGAQAVALAQAVGYDSAGTVEFVADQHRNFYFLEMNTRLQVEHPVTELVTGIDLVEQMIRVAAGEPLAVRQADVKLDGWAIETRIYAEDPVRNFLPSTGRLARYRPPQQSSIEGIAVRVDDGVVEGSEITLFYDPMIAKLVTHAPTRAQATATQVQALDEFVVDGIRHNIPFLAALMQHPRWQEGRLSTAFIAEEFPDGFRPLPAQGRTALVLAAVAAVLDEIGNARKRAISGQLAGPPVRFARRRIVQLDQTEFAVEVRRQEDAATVVFFAPETASLELQSAWRPGEPLWRGTVDGEVLAVQMRPVANGYDLHHHGAAVRAYVYTEQEAAAARLMPKASSTDAGKAVRCPMPGLVLSIAVTEGQEVKAGEPLAVVEAMKMENVLRAERDGVVETIHVKPGDGVAVDAVILEFA